VNGGAGDLFTNTVAVGLPLARRMARMPYPRYISCNVYLRCHLSAPAHRHALSLASPALLFFSIPATSRPNTYSSITASCQVPTISWHPFAPTSTAFVASSLSAFALYFGFSLACWPLAGRGVATNHLSPSLINSDARSGGHS